MIMFDIPTTRKLLNSPAVISRLPRDFARGKIENRRALIATINYYGSLILSW